MRTRTIAMITGLGAVLAPPVSRADVSRTDVSTETAHKQASSYALAELIPFLQGMAPLKEALKQANAERAQWPGYTADWKAWTPSVAESHNPSYAYAEYLWSARKDRSYRLAHMKGPIADALRTFQKRSQGRVAELFVTDARGGNVVQTQPTSDWFQGDEAKFADAASTGEMALGEPARDDTVGKVGVHVSVPIVDEAGALLGVAVALVVVED